MSFGSHNILLYLQRQFLCVQLSSVLLYHSANNTIWNWKYCTSDQKVGGAGNRLQQPTTCVGMACNLRPKLPVVLKTGWLNHSIFWHPNAHGQTYASLEARSHGLQNSKKFDLVYGMIFLMRGVRSGFLPTVNKISFMSDTSSEIWAQDYTTWLATLYSSKNS